VCPLYAVALLLLSLTVQAVMTASTLYEAVEPHIVWKQLLAAILSELIGDGSRNEVRADPQNGF
jgi:steroid 5-alpha reductase family enzyme